MAPGVERSQGANWKHGAQEQAGNEDPGTGGEVPRAPHLGWQCHPLDVPEWQTGPGHWWLVRCLRCRRGREKQCPPEQRNCVAVAECH